jgi:YtkA-like
VTFGRESFRAARSLSAACGLFLTTLACAAALIAAGCRGPAGVAQGVLVEHEISPRPPRVGPAVFNLRMKEAASSKPLGGARVRLEGNMTHAGMTPVFAEAKEAEPGSYRATLQFTMGGDWVVTVHAALPDGRRLERQFDVKGVRAD